MSARQVGEARQVTAPLCRHGEGAFWSPSWGGLRWIDMVAGNVWHLVDGETAVVHHVADWVACVRPRAGGGAVVADRRRFAVLTAEQLATHRGLARPIGDDLWATEDVAFNEGAVAPDGDFWCGSATDDARPGAGAMYRLDGQHRATRVFDEITISNGLAWTADGSTAYYVDSATHQVARLVTDPDGSVRPEPWIDIPDEYGEPDGLCADAADGLWVAMWGGSQVRHYDSTGRLTTQIDVPAPHVTSCALGGPELRTLYLTTSQLDLDVTEHPLSGALFSIQVTTPGFVGTEFGG